MLVEELAVFFFWVALAFDFLTRPGCFLSPVVKTLVGSKRTSFFTVVLVSWEAGSFLMMGFISGRLGEGVNTVLVLSAYFHPKSGIFRGSKRRVTALPNLA